jgi:hypothetical protein
MVNKRAPLFDNFQISGVGFYFSTTVAFLWIYKSAELFKNRTSNYLISNKLNFYGYGC